MSSPSTQFPHGNRTSGRLLKKFLAWAAAGRGAGAYRRNRLSKGRRRKKRLRVDSADTESRAMPCRARKSGRHAPARKLKRATAARHCPHTAAVVRARSVFCEFEDDRPRARGGDRRRLRRERGQRGQRGRRRCASAGRARSSARSSARSRAGCARSEASWLQRSKEWLE